MSLEAQLALLESVLAEMDVGLYSVSADLTRVLRINRAAEALYGHRAEEFRENPRLWLDVIAPGEAAHIGDLLSEVLRSGHARHLYRITRPDGGQRWVLDQTHRIDDPDGRPARLDCILTDITRRMDVEDALRESRERLRLVTGHIADAVLQLDENLLVVYASPSAERLFGRKAEELPGSSVMDLIDPADADAWLRDLKESIARRAAMATMLHRGRPQGGRDCWVESSIRFLYDEPAAFRGAVMSARDVTERRRLQDRLAASEASLAALIESTDDFVLALDRELRLTVLNSSLRRHCREVLAVDVRLGDRPEVWLRPDQAGLWRLLAERSLAGETANGEYVTVDERVLDVTMHPIRHAGSVTGVSVFCRDITDRKRADAELRALPERIMDAQERERRHLARELHDGVIQDLASLKLQLSGLSALPEGDRRRMFRETDRRLDTVIAGLRDLATRLRPSTLDDLGLLPAIRSYVSHRADEAGIEAFVSADLADARLAPELETNCFRIVQEAVNNALAHADPRRLFVRVGRVGAEVVLSVRDDGRGFALEERRREATRAGHFGLAVMEERAAVLGGRIEICSAPGAGTEVTAYLPCHDWDSAGGG